MVFTENELIKLGFTQKKAALYRVLLEHGRGTPPELAEWAGVKRSTAYGLLEELAQENLASQSFDKGKVLFVAENPEKLSWRIRNQEEVLSKIMPDLQSLYLKKDKHPRIRYYEGSAGIKNIYEEILKTKNKEYFYFGSMRAFLDNVGEEYFTSYIRRRIRKKIWSNALRLRTGEVEREDARGSEKNYRRVRLLKRDIFGENIADMILFDEKIAICSSVHESYGMIVESIDMYTIMKLLWDILWEVSEEESAIPLFVGRK